MTTAPAPGCPVDESFDPLSPESVSYTHLWRRSSPASASTHSPAAAPPTGSVSRKAHPPRWPSPSITRWRSSPGQPSSTTFGTPKVSCSAGEMPHARDE